MDSKSAALVIQMMPMFMREFQISIDSNMMLTDRGYANSVLELARGSSNDRLRHYGDLLRARLDELASSSARPVHRAAPSPAPAEPEAAPPASGKYTRSLR